MALDLETTLYLVAAAIVAIAIRVYDPPATVLEWKKIFPIAVGAFIAVPIGCWILGFNVLVPEGFAAAVAVGTAGLAAVKAMLSRATQKEEEE